MDYNPATTRCLRCRTVNTELTFLEKRAVCLQQLQVPVVQCLLLHFQLTSTSALLLEHSLKLDIILAKKKKREREKKNSEYNTLTGENRSIHSLTQGHTCTRTHHTYTHSLSHINDHRHISHRHNTYRTLKKDLGSGTACKLRER
jgi:hypothetical protein